ncbi:hypothetical protein OZ13_20080 [Xanthomonas cannabis pv. cannabis]|nr:hypothetical protein OZ13_20080 [Xanthomonas cannabis pv. cannabis]
MLTHQIAVLSNLVEQVLSSMASPTIHARPLVIFELLMMQLSLSFINVRVVNHFLPLVVSVRIARNRTLH